MCVNWYTMIYHFTRTLLIHYKNYDGFRFSLRRTKKNRRNNYAIARISGLLFGRIFTNTRPFTQPVIIVVIITITTVVVLGCVIIMLSGPVRVVIESSCFQQVMEGTAGMVWCGVVWCSGGGGDGDRTCTARGIYSLKPLYVSPSLVPPPNPGNHLPLTRGSTTKFVTQQKL